MGSNPNQDAAIRLAELNLRVFPCNADKTPQVKNWPDTPIRPAWQVTAVWAAHPDALPAIVTDGIVVLDCDRKNGNDGVANFNALCATHSIDLSGACVVETPNQGLHFIYRSDTPFVGSVGKVAPGVDIRSGHGNYIIAPGAVLADNRAYRIVTGSLDALTAIPEALAALLKRKDSAETPSLPILAPAPQNATEHERAHAEKALADEIEKLTALRPGDGRNHALNVAAHSLGTMAGAGWIDPAVIRQSLLDAASANGHTAKHGQRQSDATIDSGLNAGMKKPRAPLPPLDIPQWIPAICAAWIETYKAKHSSGAAHQPGKSAVTLIPFSRIAAKPVTWLWNGFIPQGKLTLLAGAGGTGKSTLAFSFAATVSNGGLWPDGSRCAAPGNVLIWSSEDDPSDTIGPRLMAVNANLDRCFFIQGPKDENGIGRSFDPARDMNQLRETTRQIGGVSLLVIDPIVNAVTGDMNKANEVRRSLQTFVDFAGEMNSAVMGITHFTKGSIGKNAAERVLGSGAFKDFSRMTLVTAKDEESNQRVFTRAKSNISQDTGGFSYSIEAVGLHDEIIATRIVWGEPLEGSSRSILAKVEGDGETDGEKLKAAKQYLIEVLSNGPTPAKELIKHASEGYGIKEDTLRRAFTALSGFITRSGFGKGSVSIWSLPICVQPH